MGRESRGQNRVRPHRIKPARGPVVDSQTGDFPQEASGVRMARGSRVEVSSRSSHLRSQPQRGVFRPDELRIGTKRTHLKLWPFQYEGMVVGAIAADGSATFKGVGALTKTRAPWPVWLGYYVIGWPVRKVQRGWRRVAKAIRFTKGAV